MTFHEIKITKAYITQSAQRGLILRCNANDCPAPGLGMEIGDHIITKRGYGGNRARVYHPYCAARKAIVPKRK